MGIALIYIVYCPHIHIYTDYAVVTSSRTAHTALVMQRFLRRIAELPISEYPLSNAGQLALQDKYGEEAHGLVKDPTR